MDNPTLLVDIWEGQPNVDFQILKDNGIVGIIIAINKYTGALQFDSEFVKRYNQALSMGFSVIPYMVYSPYHTAQEYANWLFANIPSSAKAVAIDTEIGKAGYSSDAYATEYAKFISIIKEKLHVVIYTGEGFLNLLAHWPDEEYYWAEYPSVFYPVEQVWTWDKVRTMLKGFDGPLNRDKVPSEKLLIWQCSGDRLILPGSPRPIDVDVFFGSLDDLQQFAGNGGNVIQPSIPENQPVLIKEESWFGKVNYKKFNEIITRPNIGSDNVNYHILKINTEDLEDIVFDYQNGRAETTWFVSHHDVNFAINGLDGFVGDIITGFAAYHGNQRGKLGVEQTLFIDKNFSFSLDKPKSIWSGCSFPNLLVREGQPYPVNKTLDDIRARTAFGISQDGKIITILIVDGGDYLAHHGMNFQEVRQLLLDNYCWLGVMGDGGGSTCLIRKDNNGLPVIVGKPSGENTSGQRSVAVHMGFKMFPSIGISPSESISPSSELSFLKNTINIFNNGNMEVK